ncbi:Hypothetical protein LUCI_1876 [Lucifera butyrica]|uniref:AAA+ ATPase domain-containing protein n=1 Tax=Lucifera butyrica TaxID=1351585 RepID=A0A498R6V0_9FIRM|nr:ATP-binding protein [Lucifera butyrica]VBB06640.1 Hypothetical protein LUCI_1876 [Lucifera butyrica]
MHRFILFRNILQDPIIQKVRYCLAQPEKEEPYFDLTGDLITQGELLGLKGNLLVSYIIYLLSRDENIFSTMAEKAGRHIGSGLYQAAIHDMKIIKDLLRIRLPARLPLSESYEPTFLHNQSYWEELRACFLSDASPGDMVEKLIEFYRCCGTGDMAGYAAFRWNNTDRRLSGIEHYDPIRLNDIIGYEYQKEVLIRNTLAFLDGKPANNVLLVGARGTGKSSSVKALANEYFSQGLRLVEIAKQELGALQAVMAFLRHKSKKFILFIDDLSFEEFEIEYKHLKSAIEGGVEQKPDNVVIYATSNRRHLIRENWNERSGDADDIHFNDAINEKISLSDRFGITLTYLAPDQKDYLTIISEVAQRNGICLSPEELRKEALHWEMSHSGRSGRTAQQLVNHLLCRQSS